MTLAALADASALHVNTVREHLDAHLQFVGDELRGIRRFRQHLMWYSHGLFEATAFRERVMQIDELPRLLAAVEDFFSGAEAGQGAIGEAEIRASRIVHPPVKPESTKTACNICGRRVKRAGIKDHMRDVHPHQQGT